MPSVGSGAAAWIALRSFCKAAAGREGPPASRRPPKGIFSWVSSDIHFAEALHRLAGAEVVQLEQLAHLDLAFLPVQGGIGKAPGPFHGFFLRFHLDDVLPRDQPFCFG